ncbi:lycopene cyclase domain-containing protein [Leucobacter sp. W1478]|uniref:lycopene cyclase domain-containing protein n=1 Tax=Leucobacter sp. W1478 TaxID=3439065 RepID=UPI003F30E49E
MGALYLAALLVGIGCMLLLDHRFRLFFWHDAAIASLITVLGTALFLVWDIAGIALGIFLRGDSPVATGIVLAPELPLEEPVFLIFLVLCTMIIYTASVRLLSSRAPARQLVDQP